ncbi:MAG: hypothetical protein HKL80_01915, partial [Acidimicrobiales bacterium]|nr:hypothetical protein [Acidimicrobiales bacterium]
MSHRKLNDPEHLHLLIDAMLLLSDELDLHSVLDKIVTTATELSGATYGALGILSEEGQSLSEFVTTGLTPSE